MNGRGYDYVEGQDYQADTKAAPVVNEINSLHYIFFSGYDWLAC
jgi:hypothetical protein